MDNEPQIISYYSKESQQKRNRWKIKRKQRIIAFPRTHLMRRFFVAWLQAHKKSQRSYMARLNYQEFHRLTMLPDYAIVVDSSAGISGWMAAGPHTISSII